MVVSPSAATMRLCLQPATYQSRFTAISPGISRSAYTASLRILHRHRFYRPGYMRSSTRPFHIFSFHWTLAGHLKLRSALFGTMQLSSTSSTAPFIALCSLLIHQSPSQSGPTRRAARALTSSCLTERLTLQHHIHLCRIRHRIFR